MSDDHRKEFRVRLVINSDHDLDKSLEFNQLNRIATFKRAGTNEHSLFYETRRHASKIVKSQMPNLFLRTPGNKFWRLERHELLLPAS